LLSGGKAADVLSGGLGADRLQGGSHADVFLYEATEESRKKLGQDLILDLTDNDAIDLSAIDADALDVGDQAFVRVRSFSGESGEFRLLYKAAVDRTLLQADVDGDRKADLTLLVVGDHRDFEGFVL
jgi:Ca2+-binding RTX toxin-like protein